MTHSSLTNQTRISPQSSSRNGATIDTFLIHHQAGTSDDAVLDAMVSGSRQVSANYTISNEGRLTLVVDEDRRAWTSGSNSDGGKGAAWDRRAITVEIENEGGGPDWPISNAAIATAARLLNDLRRRYNIVNVLGHRDLWERYRASYATFCPGPETVALIVATAARLNTPTQKEENMEMRYISRTTGPNGKDQWALLSVFFPDGAIVTQDLATAQGFAPIAGNSMLVTDDRWAPTLALAKKAREGYIATQREILSGVSTTPGQPSAPASVVSLDQATITALAVASAKALLDAQAGRLKD